MDIPALDWEIWEECFEDSSWLVIASRDKLIQTKTVYIECTLHHGGCTESIHSGPLTVVGALRLRVLIFICFGQATDIIFTVLCLKINAF